jgi:hypothetical protein
MTFEEFLQGISELDIRPAFESVAEKDEYWSDLREAVRPALEEINRERCATEMQASREWRD